MADQADQPIASGSSTPNRVPTSSAAFLHHLHTDPSSHHITLSASSSRHGFSTGKSPQSISVPLEPTVSEQVKAANSSSRSPSASSASNPPRGGPSSLRPLRRGSSRRGRPKTAPGRTEDDGSHLLAEISSPEMDDAAIMGDPPIPEGLQAIAASDESCLAQFAQEEMADTTDAMGMMNLGGGSGDSGTHLIGRAGHLSDPIESPQRSTTDPARRQTASPEPMGWSTFSEAYAFGLFDPNKMPVPPVPSDSPINIPSAKSSPGKELRSHTVPHPPVTAAPRLPPSTISDSSGGSSGTTVSSAPTTSASSLVQSSVSTTSKGSMSAAMAARKRAFELESISRPSAAATTIGDTSPVRPDHLALPSYSLAAATVRMASTHLRDLDFAPLGAPSPERELLDPLASVMSGDSAHTAKESASSDPGTSRFPLSRSMSSALTGRGRDPDLPPYHLPPIKASPVSTPDESPHYRGKGKEPALDRRATSPDKARKGGIVNTRIPPASAPVERAVEHEAAADYFGNAVSPYVTSSSSSSKTATEKGTPHVNQTLGARGGAPVKEEDSPAEVPTMELPPVVNPSDMQGIYEHYGWLPAPLPPGEAARRKALYRFNILHTSSDVNFDRIAHLAKLVFNPKIVLIALIDGDTQWHKSQSGLGSDEASRVSSFCSHSVLARSDEPFVVLDAQQDWRFMRNPQVVGPPHIRFYAGAPLRTTEGYNLGSLCIIDDKPRAEFTPRSRLILKEFAAIAMREMELWRDKLQLRVRDRIQTSMENFTRECLELDAKSTGTSSESAAKMDQVYTRAAHLVCSTIDLDGCFILDLSQFELVEVHDPSAPTGVKTIYRADPYGAEATSPVLERNDAFGSVSALPVLATTPHPVPTRPLSPLEHQRLSEFLLNNKDGRIFEERAPSWIQSMFPAGLRWGMAVPVFGVDQQPFAMICAYTTNKNKQFLEGYELQFLRAIGVIILSAVLRRRMVLADKTKSILISSVSHELRTPLHGILAAAELLQDTKLDSTQISFLKTVQMCGNSLIETVNHVLDFTKLSGTGSGAGSATRHGRVNLAALVEQTVEGCWVGQRARLFLGDSDIGSFYAPPPPSASGSLQKSQRDTMHEKLSRVETVIDIASREKGWNVRCEKGGLRRVLMNLVGNSLKFTTEGYIQVTLRELPHEPGARHIPVEMAVIDTGKGIGKDFLKEQLFHPFSQENPLQTGTGLGLAIVNSIVRSDSVGGKVDVWSSEGVGTEIRVSFEVEVMDDDDETGSVSSSHSSALTSPGRGRTVTFIGFDLESRGQALSLDVLATYAAAMQFDTSEESTASIVVLNEDLQWLQDHPTEKRPILLLFSKRSVTAADLVGTINNNGGHCQVVYKPVGPAGFRRAVQEAVAWLDGRRGYRGSISSASSTPGTENPPASSVGGDNAQADAQEELLDRPTISRGSSGASAESNSTVSELSHKRFNTEGQKDRVPLTRRRSEEQEQQIRPSMAPRGLTYHAPRRSGGSSAALVGEELDTGSPQPGSPNSSISTISLADGGVMLKAATLPPEAPRRARVARVMVVEDNVINRRVLGAFLKKRGFEWAEAHDGKAGVELFESSPANYWDVILMDISMPVLNGHEATRAIRKIEEKRSQIPTAPLPSTPSRLAGTRKVTLPPLPVVQARSKIFALTGLATAEDKREAFSSGVDGYLVKPVSLASLDVIFKKIGF